LERLGQLKNPMTSLGFEPATFRLVAYITRTNYGDIRCAILSISDTTHNETAMRVMVTVDMLLSGAPVVSNLTVLQ
jgi:hypothetical protein